MTFRKIVVDNKAYKYYIGKQHVLIRSDDLSRTVNFDTITGWSSSDIERAQHKQYFHITPRMVEKYIRKEMM